MLKIFCFFMLLGFASAVLGFVLIAHGNLKLGGDLVCGGSLVMMLVPLLELLIASVFPSPPDS